MIQVPVEFFTASSIGSLGVAAVIVNVTANTMFKIFRLNPQKIAFGCCLIVSYLGVAVKLEPHWSDWILAFFNSCLLFCTALGMNEFISMRQEDRNETFMISETFPKQGFFRSWINF